MLRVNVKLQEAINKKKKKSSSICAMLRCAMLRCISWQP